MATDPPRFDLFFPFTNRGTRSIHFPVRVPFIVPFNLFRLFMSVHSQIRFFALALFICLVAAGCEVRAPVSGTVTFPDGSPLTVGEIRGFGDGRHIRVFVDEDGSFEFYEVMRGDRVPAGRTYEIMFVNTTVPDPASVPPPPAAGGVPAVFMPRMIDHVDHKFTNAATSGLELVVPRSSAPIEFNIEVTRP